MKRSIYACALALLAPWLAAQAQVQAGPGTWSANQTWAADTVNGGSLTGYYYWPATAPTLAGKRALVLVLHGCQQTASGDVINNTDNGFNWKAAADQYGAMILAPNATGNVYSNHCWDYARTSHSRTSGHDGVLLDLVNRFVTDTRYTIDPQQVYVTGLSSGAGEAMVLACLAPDIVAGAGINAGPPPGTTTAQISYVPGGYTATTAGNNCRALAGSASGSFATQIASVIWGAGDYTVAQAYGPMDAAAMRSAYGGNFYQGASVSVPGGGSNIPYTDVNGKLRTAEITVSGMEHAWPAGSGGQNTNFVDATHVNYPAFLMGFWSANNLRVNQVGAPVMASCSAAVSGSTVTVSGAATDSAGAISSYQVVLNGPTAVNDAAAGSGASFTKQYDPLANGTYAGSVTASDAGTGLTSAACAIPSFNVGTPTPPPSCTATTSSNYAHVQAGRAHNSGGYALANGSNQNMGLNNTFYTTTLAQTAAGYYVIGSCP